MKIIAEIVMAIIFLAFGFVVVPNLASEVRLEALIKVNEGLSPLESLTAKLTDKK